MNHFNKLTPAEAERIALLAEECAEVIHVCGKILRHGLDSKPPKGGPTNRQMLETELGHVGFAEGLLFLGGDISADKVIDSNVSKSFSVAPYLHHNKYLLTGGLDNDVVDDLESTYSSYVGSV